MHSPTARMNNGRLESISSNLSQILNTNYSSGESQETGSSSSRITDLENNQLVLITNNFCTNFPLIKPTEEDSFKERSLEEMGYNPNIVPHWENISQPQKPDMQNLLFDRIRRHDKADVEIHIDSTTFRCHMIVLQCYSNYFAEITDQPKIIQLPSNQVTPHAFYMIYNWMLNSNPTIGRTGIVEFFKAAQFLQIDSASSQCWACICDSQVVEDAAFLLYLEAKEMGVVDVQKSMSDRICKFFLVLVASKEYLELNIDEVVMFLSSNSIAIHSEMEIFMSALRWLFHNWENRSKHSKKLIECVRFGHMTQSQLLLLKRNKDEEISQVVDDTVTKLIDDAIGLHIVKMDRNSAAFLNESAFIEPVERQWLLEEQESGCSSYADSASFIMFVDYLQYIRDVEPFCWKKFRSTNICPSRTQLVFPRERTNLKTHSVDKLDYYDKTAELSYAYARNRIEVKQCEEEEENPFNDTKILFRSENYYASESTVTSSKSQTSKVIRYNPMIDKHPLTRNSSSSSVPMICNRKKLSFTDFQMQCEHSSSRKSIENNSSMKSKLSPHLPSCETILIFGGLNPSGGHKNNYGRQIFQYIPSKNRWNMVSLMPAVRQYHSAVIFQGRIYIAGGTVLINSKHVTTNSMLSFDPATQSWFKEPDIPVKIKNFGFIATHLQIYVIGGEDNNDIPSNLVFRYDPANATWNKEEPMTLERSRAAVTLHRNHIWVAGGCTIESITDSVVYFDPITGFWTEAPCSLRVPRCCARMCSISGKLFIVGGVNKDGHSVRSIDVCENVSGLWSKIDDMMIPRHDHEILTINSHMIIIGGSNSRTGEFVSEVECYCHSKLAWIDEFEPLPVPLVGMAGIVLS